MGSVQFAWCSLKINCMDTQVPRQLLIPGNKTVLTPAPPANSNASKPKVLEKGATSVEELG